MIRQAIDTQLVLSVVDANGDSGGMPPNIYTTIGDRYLFLHNLMLIILKPPGQQRYAQHPWRPQNSRSLQMLQGIYPLASLGGLPSREAFRHIL